MIRFFILAIATLILVGCDQPGHKEFKMGVDTMNTDADAAEGFFKQAIEKDSNIAEAHLNLGLIYLNKEWAEGTLIESRKAIKIYEQSKPEIRNNLWKTNNSIAHVNTASALTVLAGERAEKWDESANSDSLKAGIVMYDTVLSYIARALELDPSNVGGQVLLKRVNPIYAELKVQVVELMKVEYAQKQMAAAIKRFTDAADSAAVKDAAAIKRIADATDSALTAAGWNLNRSNDSLPESQ